MSETTTYTALGPWSAIPPPVVKVGPIDMSAVVEAILQAAESASQSKPPTVNVYPAAESPAVHVHPPQPAIEIRVPEQAAPDVHVQVEAPEVYPTFSPEISVKIEIPMSGWIKVALIVHTLLLATCALVGANFLWIVLR